MNKKKTSRIVVSHQILLFSHIRLYCCLNIVLYFSFAVPGAVSIKNGSEDVSTLTVTVREVYEITCSAKGTKSKKDLFFDWEPDLEGGTVDSQQNAEDADLIDYTITSRYRPRKEDTIITCQLNGYVTQREIKDSVFDSITLNVRCKYN